MTSFGAQARDGELDQIALVVRRADNTTVESFAHLPGARIHLPGSRVNLELGELLITAHGLSWTSQTNLG